MGRTIQLYDDSELTILIKSGNEHAFTEIYNRYWDRLYYIAHKLLKDTENAEEIVQEVFLALWKKREAIEIQSLNQYLAARTRYAVYRHLAKEKQLKENKNILGLLNAEIINEINIDNKILLEMIYDLSNKLPEKCRLVFQYNKLQDMSLTDVAEKLNISQKTAEGHLTKALRTIRTNLSGSVGDLLSLMAIISILKK